LGLGVNARKREMGVKKKKTVGWVRKGAKKHLHEGANGHGLEKEENGEREKGNNPGVFKLSQGQELSKSAPVTTGKMKGRHRNKGGSFQE